MQVSPLSQNFLRDFRDSRESLVIFGGRVYTVEKPGSNYRGSDFFHLNGVDYPLQQSQRVSRIEGELFQEHEDALKVMMTEHIKSELVDVAEEKKKKLEKIKDVYSAVQDNTIERFFIFDVFRFFNNEAELNLPPQKKSIQVPTISPLDVSELFSEDNCLDSIILDRNLRASGVISIQNQVYRIVENGAKPLGQEGAVSIGGRRYNLVSWVSMDQLCSLYAENIAKKVRSTALKQGSNIAQVLVQFEKDEAEINKQRAQLKKMTGNSRGYISFKKDPPNKYTISISIPPYIIQKGNEFFAFGKAEVGFSVSVRNSREMMFDRPPHILNMPYLHPFVYFDPEKYSTICVGKFKWPSIGFVEERWYDFVKHKDTLANVIVEALNYAQRTLEHGYLGVPMSDFRPVRLIGNCKCMLPVSSRPAAEQYADSHGIPRQRIIENE